MRPISSHARENTWIFPSMPEGFSMRCSNQVNIPRQSRGLYEVSRSKRLSQATPFRPLLQGPSLDCLKLTIPLPETPFCLRRFARYCSYCGDVLVFVPFHRETPFRVRGGS